MHLCFFHFITSRKLTSGLQISLSSPELLTFFRRIFRLCEFGHSGVLLLCSNICYSHWDQCTYASDLHLMTSRKLTSGFDFWSCGHLRMAVMHLLIKLGADIFIQTEVLTCFWNARWQPSPSWIFRLCEFGHSGELIVWYLCSVSNLVQIFCYSHWNRRTYRGHLCMAVMYLAVQFGADIFIQSEVTDIFPKLKMAAAAILDLFGGAIGPPTKAHSWCLLPVKILSWSAK